MGMMVDLPIFPLGTVLVPGMRFPLRVFEERYQRLLADCAATQRFGVTLIKEGEEVGGPAVPHDVGTVAEIMSLQPLAKGSYRLEAVGRERFHISRLWHDRPYLWCEAELLPELDGDPDRARGADVQVRAFAAEYVAVLYRLLGEPREVPRLQLPDDPGMLSHTVAMLLHVPAAEAQALLEAPTAAARLEQEVDVLRRELAILRQMLRGKPGGPDQPRISLN
ncbi:MAG: LON peptidase substrate-binding domain-containing protein [Chloroflexota bacterium]